MSIPRKLVGPVLRYHTFSIIPFSACLAQTTLLKSSVPKAMLWLVPSVTLHYIKVCRTCVKEASCFCVYLFSKNCLQKYYASDYNQRLRSFCITYNFKGPELRHLVFSIIIVFSCLPVTISFKVLRPKTIINACLWHLPFVPHRIDHPLMFLIEYQDHLIH